MATIPVRSVEPQGDWRGPSTRAEVEPSPVVAGLHRIVFTRWPALPDRVPSLPLLPKRAPTPPPAHVENAAPTAAATPRSSIPATAREVAARMESRPRPALTAEEAAWVAPTPDELKALRERAGLSQRQAATIGCVMRGIVSGLETGRKVAGKGVAIPTLRVYVAALQKVAADAE